MKKFTLFAVVMSLLLTLLVCVSAFAGINDDLMMASAKGDLPKVKELISKGADVNANDGEETALLLATYMGIWRS